MEIKTFVCEICRKKHDNKDGLDVHMKSLHKDMEGRVNSCDRRRLQKSLKRKTEETSLIEEEEIELVNNIFVSGQELGENVNTKYPSKVESEKVSITKKRRNKIGEKVIRTVQIKITKMLNQKCYLNAILLKAKRKAHQREKELEIKCLRSMQRSL